MTNYLNGFVTIQMKAYYPYGRCDDLFYPDGSEHEENIVANSNMLPASMAFSHEAIESGTVKTTQFEVPLYNGGTMPAPVAIEIAGDVGDGVIITNPSTGQKVSFVGITKNLTSDKGRYIVCDAMNGRTVLTDGITSTDANLYHDYGFISLKPDDILVSKYTEWWMWPQYSFIGRYGGSEYKDMLPEYVGKYIYAGGCWRKINRWISDAYISVDYTRDEVSNIAPYTKDIMSIVTVNNLVVTPVSTMSLTKLSFIYKPTFA